MCVQFFHMVSIDVPAGVGPPPLNTTAKTIILSHVIVTQTTKLHVACARYLGMCVGYGFSHDLL